ncbi:MULTISPECIES: DNA mismatch repair endonuclease MutL [unclassified Clostridium]|uniref:DNA mismatch repair endonuclease MutL n=1 Tax=unclassified Clostridium TaxID=2614128 RepID=UPI0025C3A13A|nr:MULTISPECIES: DNA mismatch repair endonuclease MutL [unclassified Clostridium]
MKRINILDFETSNKIAAGEVVERASSVVKELVENSVDANSKNIIIEIEDSGNKLIKISDDGDGIHHEDIEKAFMPHATSKIRGIEDIYNINSFGFRGEALSSIAAISKVTLKSKTKEESFGKEIYVEGGKVVHIMDTACNDGTTIEVKDLFFNVPARQKFLKSAQREASLISDLVLRLALGNHDISFKLINKGKVTINTYGTEDIVETIRVLYGKEVKENIIPFEKYNDIVSVHGFIGNAEISRGSRNRQSIFVNKRLIKNSTITAAIENAFKSFLTINKFPFFVLFLDIFPEFIDPNVHPTKAEIKFFDDRSIFKLVFDGVHSALREYMQHSFSIEEDVLVVKEKEIIDNNYIQPKYEQEAFNDNIFERKISSKDIEFQSIPIDLKPLKNVDLTNSFERKEEVVKKAEEKFENEAVSTKTLKENNIEKSSIEDLNLQPKFGHIDIIGQFNNTYIIGESNNELILIDQHAAHEKYLFEKYRRSIKNLEVVSQILLTPTVIELTYEDFPYYSENVEAFENAGFKIEDFGDNTISIREVPMFLGKPDVKSLFYEILDNLKKLGSGETTEVKYNKIASLACRAAVKANDKLSIMEMEKLMEDLRYIEEPFTCPHGRPTMIKITLNELEKRFKRIQ